MPAIIIFLTKLRVKLFVNISHTPYTKINPTPYINSDVCDKANAPINKPNKTSIFLISILDSAQKIHIRNNWPVIDAQCPHKKPTYVLLENISMDNGKDSIAICLEYFLIRMYITKAARIALKKT